MNFNRKALARICGFILIILSIAMVPCLLAAFYFHEEKCQYAFGISAPLTLAAGLALYLLLPNSKKGFLQRDGYLAVMISWIIGALFGTLPYLLSGFLKTFPDAFFESMSGLSTTGATITKDYMPESLILWKSTMHWLGGMGILIFIIAILPALGVGGQRIASAEAPGSELAKMSPRITDISKMLYLIYSTLTIAEFLMLAFGSSMKPFEALVNTLGSISTAGLLYHQGSVNEYNSLYTELVMACFTIASSLNFVVYISLLKRNFSKAFRNIEARSYLIVLAGSTLFIAIMLRIHHVYPSFLESVRHAFFQVAAFASTSGFCIDNYMTWPAVTKVLLFTLLLVGGCAASTSGGLKVFRLVVMEKLVRRGAYRRMHPHSVRAVRIGGEVITSRLASAVTSFVILYGVTFLLASLVISLSGCNLETALTSAASLMSTTGGSFGTVGPAAYYGMFQPPMKIFLSLLMMVGRLELFTVFIMFSTSFWNPNRAS